MCPASPIVTRETFPFGLIFKIVILPLATENLNHASGLSCKARHTIYLITFPWHTNTVLVLVFVLLSLSLSLSLSDLCICDLKAASILVPSRWKSISETFHASLEIDGTGGITPFDVIHTEYIQSVYKSDIKVENFILSEQEVINQNN